MSTGALLLVVVVVLVILYIQHNDKKLTALPREAAAASPHRWTERDIHDEHKRMRAAPIDVLEALPPCTGRRYVVVGGAGFLGGWIVVQLLRRGEHPRRIRVLDIRRPTRPDLTTGAAARVDFRICDISDARAVREAFRAPWPVASGGAPGENDEADEPELTVFQTAASIRFYERAWALVPLSASVNVRGVENVVSAARDAGATVLVATSSGSTCVRRSRFWLWPWESAPPFFVQTIGDDDDDSSKSCTHAVPTHHNEFFSNYAYTKRLGEELVRRANGSAAARGRTLRTGVIRPGNGVFGPGGDVLCGAALVRERNPTWIANTMQNFVYVENAALAHLCFEARLLPAADAPDIGGQAFCIADKGPPPTYGDVYRALHVLSAGRTTFPSLSPTLSLMIAHVIEPFHVARLVLNQHTSNALARLLVKLVPRLPTDVTNLQPSLFALVGVHMLFDDHRARRAPAAGGLGYAPRWTTLQGLCALVDAFEQGGRVAEARQHAGGVGSGLKMGLKVGAFWRSRNTSTPVPKSIPEPAAQDGGIEVRTDALRKRAP